MDGLEREGWKAERMYMVDVGGRDAMMQWIGESWVVDWKLAVRVRSLSIRRGDVTSWTGWCTYTYSYVIIQSW